MITTLLVCCCSSDSKKVFAITLSSYDCLKNENCPHFWSSKYEWIPFGIVHFKKKVLLVASHKTKVF